MPQDFTDVQSTLVLVMACQAITWGNVDQDLCRHMAVARPQWGKIFLHYVTVYYTRVHLCPLLHTEIPSIRQHFNSLAPEVFEWNFILIIFKPLLVMDYWCISVEIAIRWMSLDLTDDKWTLVHFKVMSWCGQAASHYLSRSCPRSAIQIHASPVHNHIRLGRYYHLL